MNKGYTLTEMIAVIAIIGLVLLITIPVTKNMIKTNKEEKYMAYVGLVEKAYLTYSDMRIGNAATSSVTLQKLIDDGYIKKFDGTVSFNYSTSFNISKNTNGKITLNNGNDINLKFESHLCCTKSYCSSC